jgi:hypothetical protein
MTPTAVMTEEGLLIERDLMRPGRRHTHGELLAKIDRLDHRVQPLEGRIAEILQLVDTK